jgi:hypothetical protein
MADSQPWQVVFWTVAAFMLPGLVCTLLAKSRRCTASRRRICRKRWCCRSANSSSAMAGAGLFIIAFVLLYKIGDTMTTALSTKFFLDIGFTTKQIGLAANATGWWASLAGGAVGGIWMIKLGINRALWVFGVLQALAILGFAWLAHTGPDPAAERRLRLRGVCQPGPGFGRAGGLHVARHRPALHRHPVRAVFQPGGGAAHIHQFLGRVYCCRNRMVLVLYRVLHPCISCNDDAAQNRSVE